MALKLELLESRRLFSNVVWDGGGDQLRWLDRFNWSGNQVPASGDDAIIPALGGIPQTVLVANGTARARSIDITGTLQVHGGSLELGSVCRFTEGMSVRDATIRGGTLRADPDLDPLLAIESTVNLHAVTLDSSTTIRAASLTLHDGLTLTDNAWTYCESTNDILAWGTQTIGFVSSGSGYRVGLNLGDSGGSRLLACGTAQSPARLTIGDGIEVGGAGLIAGMNPADSVRNEGLIISEYGRTLTVRGRAGATFDNFGGLFCIYGGIIRLEGPISNTGFIEATTGGIVDGVSSGDLVLVDYDPLTQTLLRGTWSVDSYNGPGAAINLPANVQFRHNAANIELWGNYSFAAVDHLESNSGSFRLRRFTTFTSDGDLLNTGTITLGFQCHLVVSGNLDGYGGSVSIIQSFSSVTADRIRQQSLTVPTDSDVHIRPKGTDESLSVIHNLTISGLMELADNDLIVGYTGPSPLAYLEYGIALARNGGQWNGSVGITSSAARDNPLGNTTLGIMEAADYRAFHGSDATFGGLPLPADAALIKYTYYGDTDFNGFVDGDDYARADNGFHTGLRRWGNGDFDYSGLIDGDDYALIDYAFSTQLEVL
jgi:hypothetical protein